MSTPFFSAEEYEKRRHVFALHTWITDKLNDLEATGDFDRLYFERKKAGNGMKKLLEEAVPASRLALHLLVSGSNTFVTLHQGNQNYDATIEIEGFSQRTFQLEITIAETEEAHLRRQALAKYGHVDLWSKIRRQKDGSITWENKMVNVEHRERTCIELMFERMRGKLESKRYPESTAILVYLSEFMPIGLRNRTRLVQKTREYLLENEPKRKVYYGYAVGELIDAVNIHET